MAVHIGTSGWSYDHWVGVLYPKKASSLQRLDAYAREFGTVEVNNTFYRWPEPAVFAAWRERLPEGFLVSAKASRGLTQFCKLNDPVPWLERMEAGLSRLGEKRGVTLYQLPPHWRADTSRLEQFVARLPLQYRAAFEFRHPSWFNEPCLQALTDNHAAIVLADRPGDRYHPIVTADWTYVRFHKGTPRSSSYPMAKLARWADRLRNLGVAEGFIYFNNDEGGAAPRDAQRLRALLRA